MDREEFLKRAVLKCRDFVRQLAYHRAMLPHVNNLRTNIWIYAFNNYIDVAVLDWCHLFGNWNDHLHWRNLINDADGFKKELLNTLNMTAREFDTYWESVKDYRDKDIAHIEVRPSTNVPHMDKALEAVSLYYRHLISELHQEGIYWELPDNIENYINEVTVLANTYVETNVVDLFEYTEQT